ncbi:PLP-dependent aminotransferase family protein [Dyella mobilis]|uniref:PLP-dependent aminotransferase family protein n=1 Tax=Dyella mobilis TaxID=1849582 RepID=A0ABS2KDW0_9GAMM|nr:PLP-dependent aminotransferase family protein [Dyella mobilis]MBM7129040.1 PLP-dependent aminotransferase family protein [Dyella mobilis]GLQ99266.1 GntR family transcriptional regulator [Dyella mobilis]
MPRSSRGVLLPPVTGSRPRRTDVYLALRDAVLQGTLAPGENVPSSRKAAIDYGVSRGLMEEVYSQLVEEGLLERIVGRGTFIAKRATKPTDPDRHEETIQGVSSVSTRGHKLAGNVACRIMRQFKPFNAGVADTTAFPWQIWQRIQARAVRDLRRADMNFTDPRGVPALRRSLAHHLAQLRGVRCAPDQVVVFNSIQQASYLLALLLTNPGDAAWVEDPCYPGARAALELAGTTIVPVPVDQQGLQVEEGLRRAPHARLACVTPSHQFPSGFVMSAERRTALLEWAHRQDTWILEDDYDGEFGHARQPATPLHSLDRHARVLYLGTLSKSMFVSLRLAFAVVPEAMVEQLANIRTQLDAFGAPLIQLAMSRFMDEGHFSTHVRHMRNVYAEKAAVLAEGLMPLANHGWSWEKGTAGLQILLRHPDAQEVQRTAEASGLALHLLSSYRHESAGGDGLLLRFGGLSISAIRAGVEQLVFAAQTMRHSSRNKSSQ